jgi:hypothetical protein
VTDVWFDNSSITNSMEQCLSWEVNVYSADHKFPRFMKPKDSLLNSQAPATCPKHWTLQVVLFLRCPHQNHTCTSRHAHTCHMHRSSHSPSFECLNNMRITGINSLLVSLLHSLLPRPPLAWMSSLALYFRLPSACVAPQCDRWSFTHTHTHKTALTCQLCVF